MEGTITIDDILAELADTYFVTLREANDVDAKQLARVLGVGNRQAKNRMIQIAEEGDNWTRVMVYDPDSHAWMWVLRKVT